MRKVAKFLKSFPLILGVLFLGSCKLKVNGDLNVLEDFTLSKGDQVYTYSADDYEASMKLVSNNTKLRMTIKEGEQSRKFYFTIPEGTEFPRRDGEIFVPAADNGQNYDTLANVSTVESEGEEQEGWESCHCSGSFCGPGYNRGYEGTYGYRYVRYYMHYTNTAYVLNFSAPGASEAIARFQGKRSIARRIYIHEGFCF